MSSPDLEAAANAAVDAALAAGAGDAEAWVEESVTRQIRVYEGAVESLTDAGSRGIGLRVFIDGRSGYAYGTDLGEKGVRELAAAATEVAGARASTPPPTAAAPSLFSPAGEFIGPDRIW